MNYGIILKKNFEHSAKIIGERSDSTISCILQCGLAAELNCNRARASKHKCVPLSALCVLACVCVCVRVRVERERERDTHTHTHTYKTFLKLFNLLELYAVYTGSYLPTIWAAYRSYLQVSKDPRTTARPLKMGPVCCPETSLNNYQHTLRNNPEDRGPHLHRVRSLKSHERCFV